MPRGREPEGEAALSNAERQARWRARHLSPQPPAPVKKSRPARRSRQKRWNDALAELRSVQAQCAAWLDALPESLCESAAAEALQAVIDLDLDEIEAAQPPKGYGRD
jgi:hypothetical protein